MSADNIVIYPKCHKNNLSTERYSKTLRENSDIRMDKNGEVLIPYRCNCRICEIHIEFTKVEQVDFD